MKRGIYIDEIDKKLIYYYRNNFPKKSMAEKTGLELRLLENRLVRLRKNGYLVRWWEEGVEN